MNFSELATRATYLLLALGSLGAGLWLLAEPLGANAALQLQAGDASAEQGSLLRRLSAGYLCAGLALAGCLLSQATRRQLHLGTLVFLGLLASIQAAEFAAAGLPPQEWLAMAPLTLLPPLVLALMLLPLPSLPARTGANADTVAPAGSETGVVKWFDSRKGFGFITRNNGEELFVHYRSISAANGGGKALRDGQSVHFRVGQGKKGPQAEDVVPVRKNG